MNLFKKKTFITSIFLTLILCCSFLLSNFFNSRQDINTRNINVNEIGTLSYEEEIKKLLDTFDNYSFDNSDTQISFEAEKDISNFDFNGLQYLSTNADSTIKKNRTNLDIENEKFEIITEYVQDNIVVYTETTETHHYYG